MYMSQEIFENYQHILGNNNWKYFLEFLERIIVSFMRIIGSSLTPNDGFTGNDASFYKNKVTVISLGNFNISAHD